MSVKIYTRGGDKGRTALIGGVRRYKHDARVEAYGAVDEAGAFVGLAMSTLQRPRDEDVLQTLLEVQQTLWDVGSDLAVADAENYTFKTPEDAAKGLEPLIDRYQAECERLTGFVLRYGSVAASALHVACTVVRRAERRAVALMQLEPIHPPTVRYLNRLSDLLFVQARAVNARDAQKDVPYRHGEGVFHSE